VIVNKSTTINNITYVNQHVNNGVTVVSHETFVNARPVAQNVMRVDPKETASAPVSQVVAVEPVRSSVMGAGRPAPVKPPAAVLSRPVVAVRTPPPPPHPIEQRQAQAGGHLNGQALVRPVGPAQPAPTNPGGRPAAEGFKPFSPSNSGNNNQVKQLPQTQPRVYEQQGTPQPETRPAPQPENRNAQPPENRNAQPPNQNFHPPQPEQVRPAPPESHPLVRPAPPVQERSPQQEQQQEQKFNQWHQQRPASPPPAPKPAPPPPKQDKPSKKGH
jgi:hypothetical protein